MQDQNGNPLYSYQSNSDPIGAFKGLIQTIADEPAQVELKQQQDEAHNQQLAQMYQGTPVPDFSFAHAGEMQKLVDDHNQTGTDLYSLGYDPYKNGAALLNPDAAEKFKQFHQTGNQIVQMASIDKGLQNWWTNMTKTISAHPDQYAPDALDQVNNFAKQPLLNFYNGTAGTAPEIEKLEKPYDFQSWSKAAKNAIDPTNNGHIIQRLPGAIENNFSAEYSNNPKAAPYFAKAFATLPESQRQAYAAQAISKGTSPDYLYGLDMAYQNLTGKKVVRPAEWQVYGPASGRTQGAQGATYRQDLINRMLNGTPGSGEELSAITQGKSNIAGPVTYFKTNNPNQIGINIPAYTKFDPISGTTVKMPGKPVLIDRTDRKNAALTINQIINDVTGEKVNPSQLLTPGGKKHVSNGLGAANLTNNNVAPANKPKTNLSHGSLDN